MMAAAAGAGAGAGGDMGAGSLGGCDLGAGLNDMADTLQSAVRHIRKALLAQAVGGGHGRRQGRGGPWEREFGGRRGPGHWGGGGPWGAWWPGPAGPPGPPKGTKAGRGDVRAAILALLREGPMNGYQIMSEIEERSSGAWRPSPGAVYPALSQLADEGLIAGEESGGRRTYALTQAGREYIEQNPERARGAWESAEQQEAWQVPGLFAEAARLGGGIVQLAHAGTPEQIRAAERLLAKARRDLYRILADDDADDADGDEHGE